MSKTYYKAIQQYCTEHSTPPDDLLRGLERQAHLRTVTPQMIAGEPQGTLLGMLTALVEPGIALEIGTFTGYSAICIGRNLPGHGVLHTIEVKPEMESTIRENLEKAGLSGKVHLHIGDAFKIIPQIEGQFDLVFIDAGKRDYATYYDLVIDRLRPGGLIIIDNTLWGGKVITDHDDIDAQILDNLNKALKNDRRVQAVLLPLRDGLTILRKI